ncbi:hypothetical protein V6N13_001873 [Hibiscus sabdariffa]
MQKSSQSHMPKKDGSPLRAKSSMLEKSIRELEKLVSESRRRLPREIKLKLAKVARLAGISGNVMDEIKVANSMLPKKKVQRKPEAELDATHFRPEKLSLQRGYDRHKSMKHLENLPLRSPTTFKQSS